MKRFSIIRYPIIRCLFLLPLLALCGLRCETPETSASVLESSFDAGRAMEMVDYVSERWRVRGGGNPGYNETIDYIAEYLRDGAFEDVGHIEIMEVPLTLHPLAWDPIDASLSIVAPESRTLHTYTDTPTLIGRLSGSTPDGGVTAPLVDVGQGEAEGDYKGKEIAGTIVMGRGRATRLYEEAVQKRGALGVISDRLRLDAFYEQYPDMVLTVRLPFTTPDEMQARTAWALKVSPRTGNSLRELLDDGDVQIHAEVKTRFFESTQRNLIAEIPGATHPEQRIVLYAHIDNNKPGANNNSTGNAAHAELARNLAQLIKSGDLPRPARTITFLFGSEHEFSRQWLERHAGKHENILAMLNADMTGANTDLTHGIYRLERAPDPTMDLPRPESYRAPQDQSSGWGFRPLDIVPYPGHYLNDFAQSLVLEQAKMNNWPVQFSPFEGGSDHDEFLNARVPAVLSWYWEDHFISTNLDTPDKVSPKSIQQVQVLHGRIALELASATEQDALDVLDHLTQQAQERLTLELNTSKIVLADLATASSSATSSSATETSLETVLNQEIHLLERWYQWYDEAMMSVTTMPVDGASMTLQQRITSARAKGKEALTAAKRALQTAATQTTH